MRGKGISYSTGAFTLPKRNEAGWDEHVVKREMQIIANDLHCNAVRVIGADPDRLETSARHALQAGLEVWFCPFPIDMDEGQMLELFRECASRAERLREAGAEVVFVTGAELTLLARGFLPGDTLDERMALLSDPLRLREALPRVPGPLNEFLHRAVEVVKESFAGRVTYASLPSERIDWAAFDIVGVDAYRSSEVADQYRAAIYRLVAQGKPVAITEFGCTTIRGAGDLGARGIFIVERDGERAVRLKDDYLRDEEEQARYARELLALFDEAGVDSAFWFFFADRTLPHRSDPHDDLDMASYGVVKVLEERFGTVYPDMQWEPKAVFRALAEYFGR